MNDSPMESHEISTDVETAVSAESDAASQSFVGRWNQLVSSTNWEKGRIIWQWREALIASGAPSMEYSDDSWSRRVGGITAQHVGRLRRVAQRFGADQEKFNGLYWSHFQAALDWNDAEMWLEGAVQNQWSVSHMRRTRWETLGSVADQRPADEDIVTGELDEDFEPAVNDDPLRATYADVAAGPLPEGPDFGEDEDPSSRRDTGSNDGGNDGEGAAIYSDEDEQETIDFVRPFEDLTQLPDDLCEAFESYKLAILRHKTDGWSQISREDVLSSLEALKKLVDAPTENAAPF